MRKNIEPNLNTKDVYKGIINGSSKRPYSSPKEAWSIPLYYVWRILRYDLGMDTSYPIIAQGMLVNHPQETETLAILTEIETNYSTLKGYDKIRRIL